MKLHYSQTLPNCNWIYLCFSTLWNYTTLKPNKVNHLFSPVSVPYEITLLSNFCLCYCFVVWFQYLMKLHYSQTLTLHKYDEVVFQYLMKLHYSQTHVLNVSERWWFQYLMKLHYSQTLPNCNRVYFWFQYLMKLHYSQTCIMVVSKSYQFQYLMKLHYSQT